MNETKFDWDDLRLFLAVARGGGLARAASDTGKSAPTLGRRMLALERHLGQDLFRRMARGYSLTQDGENLLAQAIALEHLMQPMITTASQKALPLVKVSAGTWVTHLLCEKLPELTRADSIRLQFIAVDDLVDIARREALIGIRNRRPDGPGLAGRKINRVHFATYALDDNIKTWARTLGATPSAKWVQDISQNAHVIEVSHPRNALDLALSGHARVVLPTFIGTRYDALQQVSPVIKDLTHDQWLVTHHEDRFVPQVRKVIDRMYEILKKT